MQETNVEDFSKKILVFSGPSLSGESDLKKSLSDKFVFHSPIRCGNVLEAYREGFRIIVIVDGYFEWTASVWHKEILDFIYRGGLVIGCSSMGVLRAMELERYGMVGIGKVFEDFKSEKISDDDEVTVAHLGQSQDFLPLSDAMVNIRYTVDDALSKNIINTKNAEKLLVIAKNIFYKKRNLQLILKDLIKEDPEYISFEKYLKTSGIKNQKKDDAIYVLKNIDSLLLNISKRTNSEPMQNTLFLQNIKYNMNVTAPALEQNALTKNSKFLKMAKLLLGKQYLLIVQLAAAMTHYSSLIKNNNSIKSKHTHWLDNSWFENDNKLSSVLSSALNDCPEYNDLANLPMTVRYLCFSIEFPINLINLKLDNPFDNVLHTNSITTYSRLFCLLGLFLDARLLRDPIAQRITPNNKSIRRRKAHFTLRGYETRKEQSLLMKEFGLRGLTKSLAIVERNSLLLHQEYAMGPSSGFLEDDFYWFEKAIKLCGLWDKLYSLSKEEIATTFSKELSDDLKNKHPKLRLLELSKMELPTDLMEELSIKKYIDEHLGSL